MFYDTFNWSNYTLNDGEISPNGRWRCIYNGFGIVGVQEDVMTLQPQDNEEGTSACLILAQKCFFNFDATFKMKTVSQNRDVPNAWETAWFMFRFTDDTHHYYCMLKSNGGFELGKKDYIKLGTTQVITPDNQIHDVASQDQQQFLFTSEGHSFTLDTWYNFRVKAVGRNIKVWINDELMCDVTDDGTIGFDSITGGLAQVSSVMSNGKIGFYVEDCKGQFDNIYVNNIQ